MMKTKSNQKDNVVHCTRCRSTVLLRREGPVQLRKDPTTEGPPYQWNTTRESTVGPTETEKTTLAQTYDGTRKDTDVEESPEQRKRQGNRLWGPFRNTREQRPKFVENPTTGWRQNVVVTESSFLLPITRSLS